ncbi:MAG TPA: hypothetical protein VGE98_03935 [Thermoanaerobaculia bacterium]
MPSLKEEVFTVLRENLLVVRPEYNDRDAVLCPICLREISRDEAMTGGVEHIIPRVATKGEECGGTTNQRSGITLLCRKQRNRKADGRVYKDGCNGMKGSTYDFIFARLLDRGEHQESELTHRHGVAILTMAYLAAFQFLGYEYILRPSLDEIREQFDYPDQRITGYLDDARYNLKGEPQPFLTESGQPFVWGGVTTQEAALSVVFRRCRAILPGGHWDIKHGLQHLANLAQA